MGSISTGATHAKDICTHSILRQLGKKFSPSGVYYSVLESKDLARIMNLTCCISVDVKTCSISVHLCYFLYSHFCPYLDVGDWASSVLLSFLLFFCLSSFMYFSLCPLVHLFPWPLNAKIMLACVCAFDQTWCRFKCLTTLAKLWDLWRHPSKKVDSRWPNRSFVYFRLFIGCGKKEPFFGPSSSHF